MIMMRKLLGLLLCTASLAAHGQSSRGTFRISGQVVSAITGEPLAATRLELAPTEGARWIQAALTQKDGRFAFERLAPGKFQLYAERAGYARQGFDEHPGGFLSAVVTGSTVNSENLIFRLQPGAAIAGVITDEYGESVRNAMVILFHREVRGGRLGTYFAGQTQSDDRGLYKFWPLMAGTYFVVISARPWYAQNAFQPGKRDDSLNVAYPLTYFSDATEAGNASAINLRTGEAFRADFSLRAVAAGRIRIPASKQAQQERASVVLAQKIFEDFDVPNQAMQDLSSSEGRVISGFAPGRYLVKVEKMGDKRSERSQLMDLYGDTILDLDTIVGTATSSIEGLAYAEGVTLKNAFIQFRNRNTGEVEADRVGNDGRFKIGQIPAGSYEVSVGSSVNVYLANMAASNGKAEGRTIEIPPGADVRMAVILSKGVGEITGTAMRQDRGLSGVLVLLVPEDPQSHVALFRRDQSDSDGTFSLHQVVPGRYTLLAIENGWDLEWTNPAVLRRFLAKGQSLVVEPSQKYDLKVAVQPLGTPVVARSD